jgi:hypothetical protein
MRFFILFLSLVGYCNLAFSNSREHCQPDLRGPRDYKTLSVEELDAYLVPTKFNWSESYAFSVAEDLVWHGKLRHLERVLAVGAPVIAPTQTNGRPRRCLLSIAACCGNLEILKLLLRNGANPNQRFQVSSGVFHTPLSEAFTYLHLDCAKALIEHGGFDFGSQSYLPYLRFDHEMAKRYFQNFWQDLNRSKIQWDELKKRVAAVLYQGSSTNDQETLRYLLSLNSQSELHSHSFSCMDSKGNIEIRPMNDLCHDLGLFAVHAKSWQKRFQRGSSIVGPIDENDFDNFSSQSFREAGVLESKSGQTFKRILKEARRRQYKHRST